MDFKDSVATDKDSPVTDFKDSSTYWLQTVLEDRAESAPPPAPAEPETER
jgi:hypothetical protein